MPPISLLIKPASSLCNLRCKYCFYHSLSDLREVKSFGIMTLENLELLVKKALEEAETACNFAFQGGEPTFAGLDFFKKLIEFQKKYNTKNLQIANSIQTNGTLLNEDWAKFLGENNFLVGISIDGPKDIHDENRITAENKGTYSIIMKNINYLNKYKVEYNILSVVTKESSKYADRIYTFFKNNNFDFLQFIPCIDGFTKEFGTDQFSLAPEKYGDFLIKLFNRWYQDFMKGKFSSIREFDNYVGMAMGYAPELCGMTGRCSCQFVVESNLNVYPCDFYCTDEWLLGNLKDKTFTELFESETAKKFVAYSYFKNNECKECKYFNLCRGGCRRYKEPFVDNKPRLNFLCPAYKKFFEHSYDKIYEIASKVQKDRGLMR